MPLDDRSPFSLRSLLPPRVLRAGARGRRTQPHTLNPGNPVLDIPPKGFGNFSVQLSLHLSSSLGLPLTDLLGLWCIML